MKKSYQKPFADPVLIEPELMLAVSEAISGSADGVSFDTDSDFDSFFGS